MKPSLRILLADDHVLFRRGVAAVLGSCPNMEIAGEAGDGLEAVALARETRPDIILMDLTMPRLDGLEAIRQIKTELPGVKIIVLTVSDDDDDIFKAIQNGAQGYLIKDLKEQQLLSMIEGVAQGEACFSGRIAARILKEFQQPGKFEEGSKTSEPLTDREIEVLGLIVHGLSNKEIASTLNVTSGTIKNHVTNILNKLHLQNRLQAAVYAVRQGIGDNAS